MDTKFNPEISSEKSNSQNHNMKPFEVSEIGCLNKDDDVERNAKDLNVEVVNYTKRAQWLRAAVLGANDGLLSTASLIMGVGAVRTDVKTMVLTGVAGLVGGASSMALGELVSVYAQHDIELAQLKRSNKAHTIDEKQYEKKMKDLPSPLTAAIASACAFAVGALVPLLAAAFIKNYLVRLGVVVAVTSITLLVFGGLGAFLGRAPLVKSSTRVLVGGWVAMGITFGLTKLFGRIGG